MQYYGYSGRKVEDEVRPAANGPSRRGAPGPSTSIERTADPGAGPGSIANHVSRHRAMEDILQVSRTAAESLQQFCSTLGSFLGKKTALDAEIAELEGQCQEFETSNAALCAEMASLGDLSVGRTKTMQLREKRNSKVQAEVMEAQNELAKIEEAVMAQRETVEHLRLRHENLVVEIPALRTRVKNMEAECFRLQKEIETPPSRRASAVNRSRKKSHDGVQKSIKKSKKKKKTSAGPPTPSHRNMS